MHLSRSLKFAAVIAIAGALVTRAAAAHEWNDSDGGDAYPPSANRMLAAPASPAPRPCLDFECQRRAYESFEVASKSVGGAFALELLFPGAGSLYAGDGRGAGITWAGTAVGLVLVVYGFSGFSFGDQLDQSGRPQSGSGDVAAHEAAFSAGLLLTMAARIYGIINAPTAADRYNANLATQLSLTPSLAAVSCPDGQNVAYVPSLGGRF